MTKSPIETLTDKIEALENERLIRQTLALYCQLLDDRRFDDFGQLFTEDAEWIIPTASLNGRTAIVEGLPAYETAPRGACKHTSYQSVIQLDSASTARAWSDLACFLLDEASSTWSVVAVGRYYDRLEKSEGKWRLRRRIADIDERRIPFPGLDLAPAL